MRPLWAVRTRRTPNPSPKKNIPTSSFKICSTVPIFPHSSSPIFHTLYQPIVAGPTFFNHPAPSPPTHPLSPFLPPRDLRPPHPPIPSPLAMTSSRAPQPPAPASGGGSPGVEGSGAGGCSRSAAPPSCPISRGASSSSSVGRGGPRQRGGAGRRGGILQRRRRGLHASRGGEPPTPAPSLLPAGRPRLRQHHGRCGEVDVEQGRRASEKLGVRCLPLSQRRGGAWQRRTPPLLAPLVPHVGVNELEILHGGAEARIRLLARTEVGMVGLLQRGVWRSSPTSPTNSAHTDERDDGVRPAVRRCGQKKRYPRTAGRVQFGVQYPGADSLSGTHNKVTMQKSILMCFSHLGQ
jgi:hypothetical protein